MGQSTAIKRNCRIKSTAFLTSKKRCAGLRPTLKSMIVCKTSKSFGLPKIDPKRYPFVISLRIIRNLDPSRKTLLPFKKMHIIIKVVEDTVAAAEKDTHTT